MSTATTPEKAKPEPKPALPIAEQIELLKEWETRVVPYREAKARYDEVESALKEHEPALQAIVQKLGHSPEPGLLRVKRGRRKMTDEEKAARKKEREAKKAAETKAAGK